MHRCGGWFVAFTSNAVSNHSHRSRVVSSVAAIPAGIIILRSPSAMRQSLRSALE
jgi:hypothetical protein